MPQKETLDKAAYICLLISTSFSSVSIFSVWCYSRVFISMGFPVSRHLAGFSWRGGWGGGGYVVLFYCEYSTRYGFVFYQWEVFWKSAALRSLQPLKAESSDVIISKTYRKKPMPILHYLSELPLCQQLIKFFVFFTYCTYKWRLFSSEMFNM